MSRIRLIGRLDIKGPNLIKGINFEGLRVLGDPHAFATRYYEEGIDEIIYIDTVASLYNRDNLLNIVESTTRDVFIPITAGGGVRSLEDVAALLRSGADKVAINTAVVRRPVLITEMAQRFGSQCVVVSIEAKQVGPGRWEAYVENGRQPTGVDAVAWAQQAVALHAGELLVTSIDRDGTRRGYDLDLIKAIAPKVTIPVIASGGMGKPEDVVAACVEGGADAVAIGTTLHYQKATIADLQVKMRANGLDVR